MADKQDKKVPDLKKAVIFDLDGTLLDSAGDICLFINRALEHFGYPSVSKQNVIKFIGTGARNLVKLCIGKPVFDEHLDEVLAYYNNVYATSESLLTRPFNGVEELLTTLKENGYKLAILSNKPQPNTQALYEEHFKKFAFDAVMGQSSLFKRKPDKTSTLKILGDMGVSVNDAYFVGDGETDVLTSINAGTNGIAVLWGYRDREQLSSAGAKVFANTPSDILSILGL